ncbi:MAG: MerR family transcriptional regulator [Planctomycetota bacterium]|nr:MerR family transcriptional regulator [Planctomycetota bacterium]
MIKCMEINDTLPIYIISVASKLTETPVRMLREYEKQGIIRPKKIRSRRMFSNCEIGFIKDIRFYLTDQKMTINGLKEFYSRAGCWEIKRCNHKNCPAYGNVKKQCWQITSHHKKCNPAICPFCPIFIIKTSFKKGKQEPLSPRVYHG